MQQTKSSEHASSFDDSHSRCSRKVIMSDVLHYCAQRTFPRYPQKTRDCRTVAGVLSSDICDYPSVMREGYFVHACISWLYRKTRYYDWSIQPTIRRALCSKGKLLCFRQQRTLDTCQSKTPNQLIYASF